MKMNRIIGLFILCLTSLICQAQISDKISINKFDIKISKIQEFDQIAWQSDYKTSEEGKPELSYYKVSYVLPIDAVFTGVVFRNKEKLQMEENFYIYPVQPPIPTNNFKSVESIRQDSKVYASNTPYPGKLYELESDDFFQGYHIVTLRIYPFEYIPKSRILNYYSNLEYTIEYITEKNTNVIRPLSQSVWRAGLCRNFIKRLVQNPADVDLFGSNVQNLMEGRKVIQKSNRELRSQNLFVIDEITPDYIIITNSTLQSAFQQLADWKTKKGIFTIIVTTEEIDANYSGSDLQEKIRKYLINAYEKWGNGLYILLGGDINIIPSRNVSGISNSSLSYPTDMYYSSYYSSSWNTGGSNIFTPPTSSLENNLKVILGRIPVSNTQEVNTYINKVISYEKANNIGDLNYLKNNLYADAYIDESNGFLSDFAQSYIISYNTTYVPAHINKKYICDNANCTGSTNRYGSGGSNCSNGVNGNIELNRNNFLSLLNSGGSLGIGKFHIIYHMDHSSAHGMGTSSKDKGESIAKADMDNLSNGTSYQILMSGGCNPANFAYDCIAKHYLINQNRGGVAFIGNTDSGWSSEYRQLRDFCDAIYSTTGHPSMGRYDIGSAFQNVCENTTSSKWRLHLLGDPEMQVWTNIPQTLAVNVSPAAVQIGDHSISVQISNLPSGGNALICIQKGTEVYETKTVSANGIYTIPFTVETQGTIHVTVTAHDFFPVEETVQANTSTAPNPYISSVNFIDNGTNGSVGNGNGKNDAGETIFLQVTLKNSGINTANNLTATLSCNSDSITVLSSSANLGSIVSGNTAVGTFRYQINKDIHEHLANAHDSIQFTLTIHDASNVTWIRTFNIDVFNTDLKQGNKIIVTPSNGIIGTNQNVTFHFELQNTGQAPSGTLTAVLSSNSASNIISSCSATSRTYPSIAGMETKTASTTFQFTTGSAYTASAANFNLTVTNTYGKTWAFPFNLAKPDTIIGLKASGKEREITLTWNHVSNMRYNIYRCNVGTNDSESGSYVKINNEPVSFSFYSDVNELSALTKYYYRVTSVSQSGMESEPIRILSWTSYPTKGLFPITMGLGYSRIHSDFILDDVNNDGYKEIFSSISGSDGEAKGSLIGLSHEGNELFDTDNNVTTYNGFTDLGVTIRSGVAVGDINRDGIKEIISLTRNINNSNNKITCHIAKDGNGDHKPDILWQIPTNRTFITNPVMANIDNSPDGSLEIIAIPDGNNPVHSILIYDSNGSFIRELSPANTSSTYGAVAIADLDNDGDKEIIAGFSDGIYVWHHNGSPFSTNPFYSQTGYSFASSPGICDLNNDGVKEILVSAHPQNSSSCRIYAIKTNKQLLTGWGTSGQNSYTSTDASLSKEIAVGDLNNDGSLEVVAVANNSVKIWNADGVLVNTISLSGLQSELRTPILADIDGDPEIEIVLTSSSEGKIYGVKMDGTMVLGFPLDAENPFLSATPSIADLDNNGKSEIVAGTEDKIYVWETNGDPSRIEWGSSRHDVFNTGDYHTCNPKVIRSNTTWNSSQSICGDLIIESGTLTINSNSNITMNSSALVLIMNGATLRVDSGHLLNSNIKILQGGHLIVKNGSVQIPHNGEFTICSGGLFDVEYGTFEK
jgi:hypothetical protein